MESQSRHGIIRAALLLIMLGTTLRAVAAATDQPAPLALTNWQAARTRFQKAGALIAAKEYKRAQVELTSSATDLPEPYNGLAKQALLRLESAFNAPTQDESSRLEALSDVCMHLHAYTEAAQLRAAAHTQAKDDDDDTPDDIQAWRLFEIGRTREAIAEYQRKLGEAQVSTWQAYYQKQIELLQQRPTNLTSVPFSLEFVREHYLKGFEDQADFFCALKELNRSLPFAKDGKEGLAATRLVIQCLSSLNDEAGRDAWEAKVLRDFKSDLDGCAEVYVNRGIRAFLKKDYATAIGHFRTVCRDYPNSDFYGDAQYDLGSTFQAQKQYDTAVEEFAKLFSSNVDDYRLVLGTSEDYKLYRHKAALRISECYEAKKDYPRALDYAELARTQYKPLSWCHTCLETAKNALEKRIQQLQDAVKQAK